MKWRMLCEGRLHHGQGLDFECKPARAALQLKEYAKLFSKFYHGKTEYLDIKRTNHASLIEKLSDFSDLLFVFLSMQTVFR